MQPTGNISAKQEAANLTSGLMIGLVDRQNYDNLTACFNDAEGFNNEIKEVLTLLKSKTNENIAKSVRKIADVAKEMPDYLNSC